jgi:hypothetical protein
MWDFTTQLNYGLRFCHLHVFGLDALNAFNRAIAATRRYVLPSGARGKASGEFCTPRFTGVRLIANPGIIAVSGLCLRSVNSSAMARQWRANPPLKLEDGKPSRFGDNRTHDEKVWAVVQRIRFEYGYEENGGHVGKNDRDAVEGPHPDWTPAKIYACLSGLLVKNFTRMKEV